MEEILKYVNRASVPFATIDDWTAAVAHHFSPYVRRKRILTRDRQSLRTELINLAQIEASREGVDALSNLLKIHRAAIRADKNAAFEFLAERFEDLLRADGNWMALFMTHDGGQRESRLHDYAFRGFSMLENILEACYKLHLRALYGFAVFSDTGHFPSDAATSDFGALCPPIKLAVDARVNWLVEDPLYGIAVNQWRNIASHKSFSVVSDTMLEVRYGRNVVTSFQLPSASLSEIIGWAKRCLLVVRMANVITCLEYINEIQRVGIPNVPIRLESFLTSLCHNLRMVGFECTGTQEVGDLFTLLIRNRVRRNFAEAIIHASQVLDQISVAIESDPSIASHFKRAMVRLIGEDEEHIASASIDVEDAIQWTLGRISMKERLNRTRFDFADKAALSNALAELQKAKNLAKEQ